MTVSIWITRNIKTEVRPCCFKSIQLRILRWAGSLYDSRVLTLWADNWRTWSRKIIKIRPPVVKKKCSELILWSYYRYTTIICISINWKNDNIFRPDATVLCLIIIKLAHKHCSVGSKYAHIVLQIHGNLHRQLICLPKNYWHELR